MTAKAKDIGAPGSDVYHKAVEYYETNKVELVMASLSSPPGLVFSHKDKQYYRDMQGSIYAKVD